MPILYAADGGVVGPPGAPPPPAPTPPPYPVAPLPVSVSTEMPRFTYIAADGTLIPMFTAAGGDDTWILMPGATGLEAPPQDVLVDDLPDGGAQFRQRRTPKRVVQLPFVTVAESRDQFRGRVRAMVDVMCDGGGQVQVTEADGTSRMLGVEYTGGMEGDWSVDATGRTWAVFVATFVCPDPYWYDVAPVNLTFQVGTVRPFFAAPFFPMILSAAQVLSGLSVINDGSVDSYPTWTIAGPGTLQGLTNSTTGKTLSLSGYSIPAGGLVVIDTTQGRKTIKDGGGANLWPRVDPNPQLWPLVRGANRIVVSLAGATAASSVTLTYRRRHRTA